MAYQIQPGAASPDPTPKRKAVKDRDYLGFIHQLPCLITKRMDVHIQAAHLNFPNMYLGHTGRGKGTKASDRWVLPLSVEKHAEQHRGNEMAFWKSHRIDPHIACLVIWGLFSEAGDETLGQVTDLILRGAFRA